MELMKSLFHKKNVSEGNLDINGCINLLSNMTISQHRFYTIKKTKCFFQLKMLPISCSYFQLRHHFSHWISNDIANFQTLVKAEFPLTNYSSYLLHDCLAHFRNLRHKTERHILSFGRCLRNLTIQRSQQEPIRAILKGKPELHIMQEISRRAKRSPMT